MLTIRPTSGSGRLLRRVSALGAVLLLTALPAPSAADEEGYPLRASVAAQGDPTPDVVLRGRGWGHSVGMSQYGAYAQSRAGRSVSQILSHYYPGTSLGTYSSSEPQRVTVTPLHPDADHQRVRAVAGSLRWNLCPGVTGTCGDTVTQEGGTTWTLRVVGSDGEIELRDANGARVNGSRYARVEARLTSRDEFREAGTRLGVVNSSGEVTREYAYGWVDYRATVSGDELRMRNVLPLEGYVRGIREVPAGWGGSSGGQAALEAQAILARTYVLGSGRTICPTPRCQVFAGYQGSGGNWNAAVASTVGRILRDPQGRFASAVYSSSHGGRTEAREDSWAYGGAAVSYLRSVDDPWSLDDRNPMRRWTSTATHAEFRRVAGGGLSRIERVTMGARTDGGSPRSIGVHGPEGSRTFSTTPSGARTPRSCNREGYAGNSLRCDLKVSTRNAAGQLFTGSGDRPPSSQIRSIGFAPFTDDDGSVHEYAIVWANEAGIANGISDTAYAPLRSVTRAQMASFLFRTFDVPESSSQPFSDVRSGPHATAIASVADAGIALGPGDGTFRPDRPVTREQMATFLTRAMGLEPRDPDFRDVSGTHARNVGALAASGITTGCTPETFCPRDPVRRDQMATFLYRAARSLR